MPGERCELRKAGQVRQRPGRVEHRPAGTRAQRLVDDQPGEERLARPQAADDRGEPGRAPDLLGEPRVPRHRAPRRRAGLPQHDAAAVAHAGRGGGHGGRRPHHRAAAPVGRRGQRLAGDELARVAVLRLGVLDLHLRPVDLEHLLGARDRLGLVAARHRDPPPAVEPGVELGQAAGELVLDLEHPVRLPGQRHRRVEVVVVRVVPDLAAHLAHLALQLAGDLLGAPHVDPGGPLDGEREPVAVLHPRVVDLGDAQAVHQTDGQDGHVALHRRRAQPAHDPDRRRVRLLEHVDAVGERREVFGLPAGAVRGGDRPWRGQAERARAVHQPGDVVAGRGHRVQAAAGDELVQVPDLRRQRGQLGLHRGGRDLAQHRGGLLHPTVEHAAPGHLDAEEDLLVRHRQAHEVALLALKEAVPAQRAGNVGQPAESVVVERLRPHVHRVRPRGHADVQPAALQLPQLRGDLPNQHLALGVAAEAPGLGREPVPGHDLGRRCASGGRRSSAARCPGCTWAGSPRPPGSGHAADAAPRRAPPGGRCGGDHGGDRGPSPAASHAVARTRPFFRPRAGFGRVRARERRTCPARTGPPATAVRARGPRTSCRNSSTTCPSGRS